MAPRGPYDARRVMRIFHASDFSPASSVAFAHALKIALVAQAHLDVMHVTGYASVREDDLHWSEFPGVRATLARWGVLPINAKPEDVAHTGMTIQKIVKAGSDPVEAIVDYWADSPPDLVVLATHQREGLSRWFHRPVAEPLARETRAMTLFVPNDSAGFVSLEDGTVRLRRVLVPVDHEPDAQRALEEGFFFAQGFDCPKVEFSLLHVGAERGMPTLFLPHHPEWTWDKRVVSGDARDRILGMSRDWDPDLMVLATQGHRDYRDTLYGSTTERVLRGVRCPVLAVPEEAR